MHDSVRWNQNWEVPSVSARRQCDVERRVQVDRERQRERKNVLEKYHKKTEIPCISQCKLGTGLLWLKTDRKAKA